MSNTPSIPHTKIMLKGCVKDLYTTCAGLTAVVDILADVRSPVNQPTRNLDDADADGLFYAGQALANHFFLVNGTMEEYIEMLPDEEEPNKKAGEP